MTRGRKKITIVQGINHEDDPKDLKLKKILSAMNKEFHCSGGIVNDKLYGKIIKMTGDHREGVKNFLIRNGLSTEISIIIHGV